MAGVKGRSGRKRIHTGAPADQSRCSACGVTKDGKAFYPNAGRRNLLSDVCRDCNAEAQLLRSYRRLTRDHGPGAMQEWIAKTEARLKIMRSVLKEFV